MKDGGKRKPQDQSPTQLAGEDLPGDSCGTLVADAKKVHSLKKSISSERLNGYLSRGASDENILSHYAWNIALCESLYPSLQCLEVVLRNSLYEAVANRKGNNWISNERNPWLGRNELENIAKAKERLTERGKTTISNSDIVAEMHFGFWAGLFDVRFERAQVLWPQFLKPSFPYMPKKHRTRREISATINDIRHLRNASFHHKPIWHWSDLDDKHSKIITMIGWISPEMVDMLKYIDRFDEVYKHGSNGYLTGLFQDE